MLSAQTRSVRFRSAGPGEEMIINPKVGTSVISSPDKISIAYSKEEQYWRDFAKEFKLETIEDFYKIVREITDVCFISGRGVGFRTNQDKAYQFDGLTPALLEGLAEAQFFGKEANAKMWYCCLRYAVENEGCVDFWTKYKETSAGPRFMAIMLGQKEALDNS